MSSDAMQNNMTAEDIDSFLGNGSFIAMGRELCLVAWGTPKKSKAPSTQGLQFYAPDFYLQNKSPWVTYVHSALITRTEFSRLLEPLTHQPVLDLSFPEPEPADFVRAFQSIQKKIKEGVIKKAVPCVFTKTHGSVTKTMRAKFIRSLLARAIVQTPYGYLTPTEGMLGASPENLFVYDNNQNELQTMALAGTRSAEMEKLQSISSDDKEVFEHQLVVQGLKQKLNSFGEMQISPAYVWDLGPLVHLRTDISIELDKKTSIVPLFTDLCSLLHPTAALGVAPQTADWRILTEFEGSNPRLRFGAPFGVLNPSGRSVAVVAIRNVQWDESGVFIGSGCGVVEQSKLESEWQELALKRKSILQLLGL